MNEPLILSPITPAELARLIATTVRTELDAHTTPAATPPDEYLPPIEAAQLLRITLPTLRAYDRKGIVTGYRLGSRVRYRRNELLNGLRRIHAAKQDRA